MGIPMLDELPKLNENSVSILELSSFQLQDMDSSPHIAVVLDISPDHLNYHRSFKEYLEAKAQLVKNKTSKLAQLPLPKPQAFQDFSQRDGARLSNSSAGEYAGLEKFDGKAAVFFFPDNKFSEQIAQKGKGRKIGVIADRRLKLK